MYIMERILIVENRAENQKILKDILELSGYLVEVASSVRESIEKYKAENPDLILCSAYVPEVNALKLMVSISEKLNGSAPKIIFLNSGDELSSNGSSLGLEESIFETLSKSTQENMSDLPKGDEADVTARPAAVSEASINDKLALPCEDGLIMVPFKNIIRCQAERSYCQFHLKDGKKILVSSPMKEFEERLVARGFLKVHKSTIINISCVDKYLRGKGGQLLMCDGSIVYVAVRKKDVVMKALRY